jgi:hypothetical protein
MTAGAGGTAGEAGQGGSGECDSLGWVDDASQLCWHAGGITDGMTHRDAQLFCQALAGGLSGWRLPTVDELKAQVRGCSAIESCEVSDPDCLDSSCAPNDSSHPCYGCEELAGPGPAGCYWQNAFGTACLERVVSGTEVSDGSGLEFWTVSFSTGGVADDFAAGAVLCVKPAQ